MLSFARDHALAYPLSPVGGLFFIAVGLGIMVGAFNLERRNVFLIAGVVLASITMILFTVPITRGLLIPSRWQVGWLIGPVVFEAIVTPFLVRALRPYGERIQTLGILILVGFHFLPMAPAFGLPVVALGLLAIVNALFGLGSSVIPLRRLWAIDGFLKFATGLVLLAGSSIFNR